MKTLLPAAICLIFFGLITIAASENNTFGFNPAIEAGLGPGIFPHVNASGVEGATAGASLSGDSGTGAPGNESANGSTSASIDADNEPPLVPTISSGPSEGYVGKSYSYSCYSTDPESDKITYSFDWGDGSDPRIVGPLDSGKTATASHSWDAQGNYYVMVTATDSKGATSDPNEPYEVNIIEPVPSKPTAPSGPANGYAGKAYSFSSSATEPLGGRLKYRFEWGDGSDLSEVGPISSGKTVSASHAWESAGGYEVTVIATTSGGLESEISDPSTIEIEDPVPSKPTAPSGPATGYPSQTYTYSTSSVDPLEKRMRFTFSWGDGSEETVTSLVSSGSTASASHTFEAEGEYFINAVAVNENELSSEVSDDTVVVISNVVPSKPLVPSGPAKGTTGTSYSFSTSATDPLGRKLSYDFGWGDGTALTRVGPFDSGKAAAASHTWIKSGTFGVTAKAISIDDVSSETSEAHAIEINSPPEVPTVPSGPSVGSAGTAYSFVTSATDPDEDQVTIKIDWGDGSFYESGSMPSGTKVEASHIWSKNGVYSITAMATDGRGASSVWSGAHIMTINTAPEAPAKPTGPASMMMGATGTYSTSAKDADKDDVKITIDWGDGTTSTSEFVKSSEPVKFDHTWEKSGAFDVLARAMDSKESLSGWSAPLSVAVNAAPEAPAKPAGPDTGDTKIVCSFESSSFDPNGDKVKLTFDWGDGKTTNTAFVPSSSKVAATHAFTKVGQFTVRARAKDSAGAVSPWSVGHLITINTPPSVPAKPAGPAKGIVGGTYEFKTSAKDPNKDQVAIIMDWGDGTTSESEVVASGCIVKLLHVWSQAKKFSVKAMARDSKGSISAWSRPASITITLNDPPLKPKTPLGPSTAKPGVKCAFSSSSVDPNKDKVRMTFIWGDGTSSTTGLISSGSKASASHVYSAPGIYIVQAQAADINGAQSEVSDQVQVIINTPPATPGAPVGPGGGAVGTSYTFTLSSADPDGDRVKHVIDWGDKTATATELFDSGAAVAAMHSWTKAGSYSVKAKAVDEYGAESAWSAKKSVKIA